MNDTRIPPPEPTWRASLKRPVADVAHRGADMCRQALGLPPKHTLPVEEPETDDDDSR